MRRRHLAQRRKVVGLNQVGLAHQVGVDRSTVVRWERGETTPRPWCRPRLARVLGVSREALDAMLEPNQPVSELANLDVSVMRTPDGFRVQVTDPRCGLKLISLDPRQAASLGGVLVAKAAKAGHLTDRERGT